jgi:hypothetical protein
MNTLTNRVTKDTLSAEYVKILNGILGLSEREALVFSFLLDVDSAGKLDNINTKEIRTAIIAKTGISAANLSRYLGVLKDKGLLIRGSTGKWVLNDIIRPVVTNGVFELKFILNVE